MPDKNSVKSVDEALFDEKADLEYNPSNWPSQKHAGWTAPEVLTEYIKECSACSSSVYNTFSSQLTTLRYGEGSVEEMDIIAPKSIVESSNNAHSLLAFFHGGYWQEGHFRHNSMSPASPVVRAGYYYAAIGYLDDKEQLPLVKVVEQAVSAVNKLTEFASTHSIRSIVLSGHSAGAHLVAMVAMSNRLSTAARSMIRGLVLLSGVYNLPPILNTSINIPELALADEATARQLSPIHRLASEPVVLECLSKIIIGYGEYESVAFRTEANDFFKALSDKGLQCNMHVYEDKDHFTLITDSHSPTEPLAKDLVAMLDELNEEIRQS